MAGTIFPDIDPNITSGTQLATILNDFKDGVASTFATAGGTRPTNLASGGLWIDMQNDPIWDFRIYDGTDDITILSINTTTNGISIGAAADALTISKVTDDTLGAILELFKARLTGDQTLDGDTIGEVNFTGYTDLAVKEIQAQIKVVTTDDVTAGAHGSYMTISTTSDASSALVERIRISNSGKIGIGATVPDDALHVRGTAATGNIKNENFEDSTTGSLLIKKKRRATGVGQVLSADNVSTDRSVSTDEAGAEVIVAETKVTATENSVSTQHGAKYTIAVVRDTETALTEELEISNGTTTIKSTVTSTTKDTGALVVEGGVGIEENLHVGGNFTVDGTTTTLNTATLDVEDSNITISKGGTEAAADDTAGITVEMSDATDASILFDKDAATKFRIGEVGSEIGIVDESTAQDVSNKAIITPSRLDAKQGTHAALVTYAGSAANGQFCFATDQKVMYQVVDNALVSVGSGGGGLDVFYAEDFEVLNAADFTTGQNATFDNGGTIGGALADETGSPISGDASVKYTTHATATNSNDDFFYLPAHTLDDKQKGNDVGINAYYTWDGSDDLIEVVIFDDTNNVVLSSSLDLIKTQSNATRYSTSVFIPLTCNAIKIGFHHTGVSESSKVLTFDDIELSTDPFVYKNITNLTEWELYTPTYTGFGTVTVSNMYHRRVGDSVQIRGVFTCATSTAVEPQITLPSGLTSVSTISVLEAAGVGYNERINNIYSILTEPSKNYFTVGRNDAAPLTKRLGSSILISGDDLSFNALIPIEGWTATTEHVITPAKANSNSFSARIDNNGTATILSQGGKNELNENAIFSVFAEVSNRVTIVFNTGFFTETPAIVVTSSEDTRFGSVTLESATGCTILMENAGGASVDSDFDIVLHRQGNDIKDATLLAAVPIQKVAYIKDVKATTVDGGTFTLGAWRTRDLNTLEGDTSFLSLNANQISLGAGLYIIEASAPSLQAGLSQIKLRNITTSTNPIIGASMISALSGTMNTAVHLLKGVVEITSNNIFEIQHYGTNTHSTFGFGEASDTGEDEIYTQVKITKLR